MAILKSEIRNKYTTVPNSVIRAKDLSDAEYRLLMYLYSLPDGWKINQGYLGSELNCSRININKKLRRIKELGYLEITKSNENKSTDFIYTLKEKGVSISDVSLSNVSLNDVSVSDTHINTNIINTEIIKKDITNITEGNNTIYDFIEQNFGRTLNSIEFEKISKWEDNILTRHAIEIAVLNRTCNIPYIEAILRSYRDKGIQTIEDALKEEQNFQNNKKRETLYKTKSERLDDYVEKLAKERGEL